ncbi:unnamed protein product, partial [Ixodes hexagonus]
MHTFRRTKVKLQGTKKKGCVATMHLKIIETFPAFKVEAKEGASQHQIKRLKTAQLAKLSEALSSGQALNSQKMIFLTMSRKSCHTEHDFSEIINFGQTVDVSVRKKHSLSKVRGSLRENSDKVKGMAMYCTDKDKLKKAYLCLIEAQKHLLEETPTSGGIVVRGSPTKGCSGERKRKSTGPSTSFRISALKK